jgi:hypothetical protein
MKDSSVPKLRFPLNDYLQDYYQDRDVDLTCQTIRMVRTRKEHDCHFGRIEGDFHVIPKGELAVRDTASIDHEFWGTCYNCIPCLDKRIAELNSEICENCRYWDFREEDESDKYFCLNPKSDKDMELLGPDETCSCFEKWDPNNIKKHIPSGVGGFKIGDKVWIAHPNTKHWPSFGEVVDITDKRGFAPIDVLLHDGTTYSYFDTQLVRKEK